MGCGASKKAQTSNLEPQPTPQTDREPAPVLPRVASSPRFSPVAPIQPPGAATPPPPSPPGLLVPSTSEVMRVRRMSVHDELKSLIPKTGFKEQPSISEEDDSDSFATLALKFLKPYAKGSEKSSEEREEGLRKMNSLLSEYKAGSGAKRDPLAAGSPELIQLQKLLSQAKKRVASRRNNTENLKKIAMLEKASGKSARKNSISGVRRVDSMRRQLKISPSQGALPTPETGPRESRSSPEGRSPTPTTSVILPSPKAIAPKGASTSPKSDPQEKKEAVRRIASLLNVDAQAGGGEAAAKISPEQIEAVVNGDGGIEDANNLLELLREALLDGESSEGSVDEWLNDPALGDEIHDNEIDDILQASDAIIQRHG